jgi:hypothetical protein
VRFDDYNCMRHAKEFKKLFLSDLCFLKNKQIKHIKFHSR